MGKRGDLIKMCIACRRVLLPSAFTAHPRSADRLQSKCKACCCEYSRARYRAKRGAILDYKRKRHGPQTNESTYASRRRHPEKFAARRAVLHALKTGKLIRQPCEICKETRVHAHHDDYSKPLQVRWLCSTHHGEAHRAQVAELIGETA